MIPGIMEQELRTQVFANPRFTNRFNETFNRLIWPAQ
jgi:hypothetical protein